MKSKKGGIFFKVLWMAIFCIIAFMGFCEAVSEDLTDSIVRIHVIANSNSTFDQNVKLKVRDIILKEANALSGSDSPSLSLVERNKPGLERVVNAYLREQSIDYTCSLQTGRFYFPAKSYENITLPQGEYDALRVVLGAGEGENWWCVMYPPLCFTESARGTVAQEDLQDVISPVSGAIISEEHITLKPALKCVDLWQAFKKKVDFVKTG